MNLLSEVRRDIVYALRMLRRNPAFTCVVVITLALGIGANSAIFSVVDAVLLRPLPYRDPGQLVRVYTEFPQFPHGGLHRFWLSNPEYLELHDNARSWSALEAWQTFGGNLNGSGQPIRIVGANVTGGLLKMLGVAPVEGRLLDQGDDHPGAPPVADLSWPLWQSAFGGNRAVVGQTTRLNGADITIIGVMPRGFEFPIGEARPVQLWSAMQLDRARPGDWGSHGLDVIGRLHDGVTLPRARAEFVSLESAWGAAARSAKRHNLSLDRHPVSAYALRNEVTGDARPALLLLLGAVVLVLLTACVNVAGLLMARSEARQREIAVRAAIGADWHRLLRQFISEGVVLALLGAAAGLGLAEAALRNLDALSRGSLPRLAEVGLNAPVFLFTLALALATGMAFGLTPLVFATGGGLFGRIKVGASASRGALRFRKGLVAGEIALALALLAAAGLAVRGIWNLQHVDLGFDPAGVNTSLIALAPDVSDHQAFLFLQRLQAGLDAQPAMLSALAYGLPPNRNPNDNDTGIAGFVPRPGGPIQNVEYYQAVTPSYRAVMRIPLLSGRWFNPSDGPAAPPVVVVNQRMAETFWPGQSPLGHMVQPGQSGPWARIVGVVADVKNKGVDQPAGTELYLPMAQAESFGVNAVNILTRSQRLGAVAQINEVRGAVRQLDPSLPLANVAALETVMARSEARPRMLAWLLWIFAALALILAAVGVYGMMNHLVLQRRREFGVRIAIGAEPQQVMRGVLGQGFRLALIGALIGAAMALFVGHLMRGLLFGVGAADPLSLGGAAALLIAVAVAACWLPAWRAMRTDPVVVLRDE
jgi:predicted permease